MRLIIPRSSNHHIDVMVLALSIQESGLREPLRDLLENSSLGIRQRLHVPISERLSSAPDVEVFRENALEHVGFGGEFLGHVFYRVVLYFHGDFAPVQHVGVASVEAVVYGFAVC